jgi:RND family efflux transporter MFP subunit
MLGSYRGSRWALWCVSLAVALSLLLIEVRSLRSTAAVVAPANPLLLLPGALIRLETGFDLARAFSGHLMSYQDAGLGFEVAGVVDVVLVADGDTVVAGQVLARLRQADQRAAIAEQRAFVAQAEAAVEEARAHLRQAEFVRERRLQLAVRELLAAEALEMAETDLDSQRARLRAAEAAAAYARASLSRGLVRLDQTELRAPHDGVVAGLPARVGQALDAGAAAVRLVDLNDPLVHVGLPVALAATLEQGAELQLLVAGQRHSARLISLAPAIDAPTRTVLVVLRPATALPTLRAGELVRVEVGQRNEDQGAWLPLSALVEGRRGLWSGHFIRPQSDAASLLRGQVERRPLQVVHVRDDHAYVRGPFAEGDIYLRAGLHRAVPGQEVRVTLD